MDIPSLASTNSHRVVTPSRGGEKREDQQDNLANEQLSQAEARRRAQDQAQMRRTQQHQHEQQQAERRLQGRLVTVADNSETEYSDAARAEAMRDKIERTYSNQDRAIQNSRGQEAAVADGSRSYRNVANDQSGDAIDLVV